MASATKIVALLALAATGHSGGMTIFAAWAIGNLVSLPVLSWRTRGGWPLQQDRRLVAPSALRGLGRGAAGHYSLNTVLQVPLMLLPVLVTVLLGARDNGVFGPALQVTGFVFALPYAVSLSLFAAAEGRAGEVVDRMRVTVPFGLAVSLLANAALFPLAPWVLRLFGSEYAEQGTPILRLLVLAGLPFVIKDHYVALRRVQNRTLQATAVLGGFAVLEPGRGGRGRAVARHDRAGHRVAARAGRRGRRPVGAAGARGARAAGRRRDVRADPRRPAAAGRCTQEPHGGRGPGRAGRAGRARRDGRRPRRRRPDARRRPARRAADEPLGARRPGDRGRTGRRPHGAGHRRDVGGRLDGARGRRQHRRAGPVRRRAADRVPAGRGGHPAAADAEPGARGARRRAAAAAAPEPHGAVPDPLHVPRRAWCTPRCCASSARPTGSSRRTGCCRSRRTTRGCRSSRTRSPT
ncbi:hypothetical protein GCM10025868_32240 [Angustibacter aerolatus]|uniref:Polysaccharide biosynthesis protein C-terminal domain-containing protein n=1 Tax=Angustibacter aerolatus TaxID=1162965 RepID=A0ABQ6JJB8_9ACTN|nr:hypothetical protein GCM10025868_32240 [Angustibacter aerolatus]